MDSVCERHSETLVLDTSKVSAGLAASSYDFESLRSVSVVSQPFATVPTFLLLDVTW